MPQGITPKKGKKNRKLGRNAAKCAAYRTRSYTIKLSKIRKHLRAHPTDSCAVLALKNCLAGGAVQP